MSYEKQTWATGDTVTAEKLNHMEDGIDGAGGGGAFFVTVDMQTMALNKTWNEIFTAAAGGSLVFFKIVSIEESTVTLYPITQVGLSADGYDVVVAGDVRMVFETNSADGYPVFMEN